MSEAPITTLKTPVRFEFTVSTGVTQARFLRALTERRILGSVFDDEGTVYVPTRTLSPTTGEQPSREVEVDHVGTLTTFCVINIPFEGQRLKPPYVCGAILLDGASLPIFHIIAGVDVAEVRMGLRVRAVWVDDSELQPTLESIRYFEPTGESDAPYDSYAGHL